MDKGTPDQVHKERLEQQDADHAAQLQGEGEGEDRHESGRGGALHRLAEQGTARDDDAA